MTPRSLVGMTMGARKRAWLAGRIDAIVFPDGINTDELEMKSAYSWPEIRRWWQPFGWQLLGQRMRPCPGCVKCTDSPRLLVMGWVRRIGGRAKLTRIFSRWYQRAEYLLMICRPGPNWNPAAGGAKPRPLTTAKTGPGAGSSRSGCVTKSEAWANMCNCLRDHNELNVACDGSGVLPARAKKVRR